MGDPGGAGGIDAVARRSDCLGVRSIPTLMLIRGGAILDQMIGAAPRAAIEAAIRRRLRDQ